MKNEKPKAGASEGNSFRTASSTSPGSATFQSSHQSSTPTTSGPPRSLGGTTLQSREVAQRKVCQLRPQEEAHLVPDKHKIHPPDISDERLALL